MVIEAIDEGRLTRALTGEPSLMGIESCLKFKNALILLEMGKRKTLFLGIPKTKVTWTTKITF